METLKKALAEAQETAAKEQAAREKHEARVGEVQQELQDAVKKCKSLERQVSDQESKLDKTRQSAQEARTKSGSVEVPFLHKFALQVKGLTRRNLPCLLDLPYSALGFGPGFLCTLECLGKFIILLRTLAL